MAPVTESLSELMARVGTWPEQAHQELARLAFDIEMSHVGGYEGDPSLMSRRPHILFRSHSMEFQSGLTAGSSAQASPIRLS